MNRFIVEIDFEGSEWSPDELRDAILDGMGYPLILDKEPERVQVRPAPLDVTNGDRG